MRYLLAVLIAVVALALVAAPAAADWKPIYDSTGRIINHKMHYPQMPDPDGWDIDMTNFVLADDWKCSETGPVDDIHFWFSVEHQTAADPANPPNLGNINVSIHDDVPLGDPNPYPFSHPGMLLRQWTFVPGQYKIAGPWPGYQGWDVPPSSAGTVCPYPDHFWFWQVNITQIGEKVTNPFTQREGKIYWLDLNISIPDGDPLVGWKTTLNPFNDVAVYRTPVVPGWSPVLVCEDDSFTDFAFVITPEPGMLAMLLGAGLIGLVACGRRRRRS